MPTDEKLIVLFSKIHDHCRSAVCSKCRFNCKTVCQMKELFHQLDNTPNYWNMEEIERIINL